ncbi:MAG: GIY-YIG nuclease family protein, partial [Bacteroidota bacterium]
YVGECEDLAVRYNTGYGQISPRNCYEGGQPTNCRINAAILREVKAGRHVRLFWRETGDRFNLESHLIERFDPALNRSAGKHLAARAKPAVASAPAPESLAPGKYEALRRYLEASPHELEFLSYRALEEILGDGLPASARTYTAWWANGGHVQAEAWMEAGWRVVGVELKRYTVWRKSAAI